MGVYSSEPCCKVPAMVGTLDFGIMFCLYLRNRNFEIDIVCIIGAAQTPNIEYIVRH